MLVVMAKVPTAGRSKTRLIPHLGAEAAASLSAAMTVDVFARVQSLGEPWRISVEGDLADPWVHSLPAPWEPQARGDLGHRLLHALRDGGIAIGTDAPTFPSVLLEQALGSRAQVCIAPAFDGGYTLVGCQDPSGIFEEIPWSSADTFRMQVARVRHLRRSLEILPFWYDVDTWEDLQFLRGHLTVLGEAAAPRTWQWLQSTGLSPA